jgi:hypothetical protein
LKRDGQGLRGRRLGTVLHAVVPEAQLETNQKIVKRLAKSRRTISSTKCCLRQTPERERGGWGKEAWGVAELNINEARRMVGPGRSAAAPTGSVNTLTNIEAETEAQKMADLRMRTSALPAHLRGQTFSIGLPLWMSNNSIYPFMIPCCGLQTIRKQGMSRVTHNVCEDQRTDSTTSKHGAPCTSVGPEVQRLTPPVCTCSAPVVGRWTPSL